MQHAHCAGVPRGERCWDFECGAATPRSAHLSADNPDVCARTQATRDRQRNTQLCGELAEKAARCDRSACVLNVTAWACPACRSAWKLIGLRYRRGRRVVERPARGVMLLLTLRWCRRT